MIAQVILDLATLLGIATGAITVIGFLYRALISSKNSELKSLRASHGLLTESMRRELKAMEGLKESWQDIAHEAVEAAKEMANYTLQRDDKPPLLIVEPVVPESHSPVTLEQMETARMQTLRATMANIKLAVGQEPRV